MSVHDHTICRHCGAQAVPTGGTASPRCLTCNREVCPPPPMPLTAAETIFQMRHHVQLALGDLAKLAKSALVTTPARGVIEQRLYAALRLADAFDGRDNARVLNLPGLR